MTGGLARAILGRLAAAVALFISVATLLFATLAALPGDAVSARLGAGATPETTAALRQQLGLDRSAPERLWRLLSGIPRADLGTSAMSGRSVWAEIRTPVFNSMVLGFASLVLVVVGSITLGTLAGRKPGSRVDRAISGMVLGGLALPEFVVGTTIVGVLALWLRWLPAVSLVPLGGTPLDDPSILIIPALAVAVVAGCWATRYVRAAVASVATARFVESARLAGLPARTVVLRYLLPSALGQIAQVQALVIGYLVGGTVVVERLVAYPGLGSRLVTAVTDRDEPVVLGAGLILAAFVIAVLVVANLVTLISNPKMRRGSIASMPPDSAATPDTTGLRHAP